jgi:trigger factor
MNVSKHDNAEFTAVLTVTIDVADYTEKYEKALKSHAKKVNIKGFRPGTVPLGMVKKMYGKGLLADEINRIINDSIHGYLKDNEIEILGNPMPKEGAEETADWDNPSTFEFQYEIGLAPVINFDLAKLTIPHYSIKIEDDMVSKQVEDMTRRFGTLNPAEIVEATDMLLGNFVELDDASEIKACGIMHSSTISLEFIESESVKNALIGKKQGDAVDLNPHDVSKGEADLAAMLGIKKEQLGSISNKFRFTINEIKRMTRAEINEDLFKHVFPKREIADVDAFTEEVKKDLKAKFDSDSRYMFGREARVTMLNKLEINLPNEFLKRWILASNEKPLTIEQLESEFDHYADDLKWQLIENKIVKDSKLEVTREELVNYTKGYLIEMYARYGLPPMEDSLMDEQANKILAKQEEAREMIEKLSREKVLTAIRESVTVTDKAVTYDEFLEILKELNTREHANHAHAQVHDHVH